MTTPIRILVADDHAVARAGVSSLLSTQGDMEVVDHACDGAEALALCQRLRPDVLVLDIRMPMLDGVAVIRLLMNENRNTRILVFTNLDDDEHIHAALKAGALGYLTKGSEASELIDAVRSVAAGRKHIPASIAQRFIERSEQGEVTPRQGDVLRELAAGRTNRQIADKLNLSERTVVFHVSKLLAHFGAQTRTELANVVKQRGIDL
jgi:DNA-binding NarL/FixJ family response regulator